MDEKTRLEGELDAHEERLSVLVNKRYLTEDEKLEEVRLKKLRLRLKDLIEQCNRQSS